MQITQLRALALLGFGLSSLLGIGCAQEAAEPEPPVAENPAAPAPAEPIAAASAPAGAAPAEDATRQSTHPPAAQAAPAPVEPDMPEVLLSEQHKALCKVFVGDKMPEMMLPNLEGRQTALASLYGRRATVVFFFDQSPASQAQLTDMGPDVASPASERGVQVIGVAVNAPLEAARQQAQQANAHFPILVDATGGAFSQVGIDMLPRTYLLDPTGKILWFDIEYSRTTRRQLQKAIDAVLGDREIED